MASSPQQPEVAAPALMPDDDMIATAKRKALARQRAKGGTASTILSDAGSKETLG